MDGGLGGLKKRGNGSSGMREARRWQGAQSPYKCVDIRLSDPDSVTMLLHVLQVPVLRRQISVGEPGKGPGTSEQQRAKTQVDVEQWVGFHRPKNSAYKLSNLDVAEGRPAVGTPVPCLDAVAYGRVHNDTGHFRL